MMLIDQLNRLLCRLQGSSRISKPNRNRLRRLLVEQMENRRLLATIDLATLNASDGTTIFGANQFSRSGYSVRNAGDVNRDGFDDVIIGALIPDGNGSSATKRDESYVVFGAASIPSSIDLANLGSAGITIIGTDITDYSGSSVSGAGDVNGDGFDDLVVGAYSADAMGNLKRYAGDSYIIYGAALLPRTIDLANLGSQGVTLYGADASDRSGFSVSSAGDVNGDGFDDLVIGAPRADAVSNSKPNAGETYLIFGAASLPATIDLANLGAAGSTISGTFSGEYSGISVSEAGDVNGDGFDDFVIGANRASHGAGKSYLIFGASLFPRSMDLTNLGSAGTIIYGVEVNDRSGRSVSTAGDVNRDGFDDILIGADGGDGRGNGKLLAGESYLVFGAPSLPASIDLANLGSAGVTIFGANSRDYSGVSVRSAGDMNGDGFDDVVIGAYQPASYNNFRTGVSYVIFGAKSFPSTIDLFNSESASLTILGAAVFDKFGFSVSSAGDTNGDGFDDLILGAVSANGVGNAKDLAGESYLIYGKDFSLAITHKGTSAEDHLTGNATDNLMVGGRANDTLVGGGGADVLTGGQGDDILAVSDLTFNRIVGGTGNDTLRLDGSNQLLDLTTLPDNRILGIERIDITGTGNNSLTLNLREVLNISAESNTLIVFRDESDVVNFGSGWTQGLDEAIGPSLFYVYVQGAARLKIQKPNEAPIDISLSNNSFAENVPLETIVGSFSSVDPDPAVSFTYSLVPGIGSTDNDAFAVTGNQLKTNAAFDFEKDKSAYNIRVKTADVGGLTFEKVFTINLTNVNDIPGLVLTNVVTTIAESNASGLDVADVAIEDDALGTNNTILSGPDAAMFQLSGGKLKLKPSSLDFETKPTLQVTISVDDPTVGSSPDQLVNIVLNVTDVNEVPELLLTNVVSSVPESNTAGLNIADFTVRDDVLGTNLISLSGPDAAMFELAGGKLKLKPSSLDFETKPTLRVTVSVDDSTVGTTPDQSINLVLNVTDVNEAPVMSLSEVITSVPESNILGIDVANVIIADDALGAYLVILTGPDATKFQVSGGKLKLQAGSLDFETKPTLRVTVSVDDSNVGASPDQSIDVVLNVTDINEAPSLQLTNIVGSVPESVTDAFNLADITVKDDALGNNTIVFSGRDAALFEVAEGKIRIKPNSLDYEAKAILAFTVSVDDATVGSSPDQSIDLIIFVSDVNETPQLVLSNVVGSVLESNAAGFDVAGVQVNDDALGTNQISLGGPDAALFEVSSGKLRLKPGSLDFETKPTLRVTVSVDDPTIGSTPDQSIDVILSVTDVNEVPGLQLTDAVSSVPESNTLGLDIANVAIQDDALGNNVISLSGPDAAMFEVSGGKIKLKPSTLDFETKSTLRVTLAVDDPTIGTTPDQAINLVINVTDINEVPGLLFTNVITSVLESSSAGLAIAGITITDDGLGSNLISLSGPDVSLFEVSGGKLRLKTGSLDFETRPTLRVSVSVDDPTVGSTPDQAIDVVLNVTDVNEAPTEVVLTNIHLRAAEEITLDQAAVVADIAVKDDAIGTRQLSLKGPDVQYFEIVDSKLRLKAGTRFNFEVQPTFQVRVEAKDPALTDSTAVFNDYTLSIDNIPEVTGVQVIDGQGWNSSVKQVRIGWDSVVELSSNAVDWKKQDIGGAMVPFVLQTSVVNNQTVADIRFEGKYVDTVGLLDGSYELVVRGDHVTASATSFLGLGYMESFTAMRPKPAYAMNIGVPSSLGIGSRISFPVQLVGLNESGNGIRYEADLDGDGITDRTALSGSAATFSDVVFTLGGSKSIQIKASRNGAILSQGSVVVDVVPYTVRGARWTSTLDVDSDETVSPLDVLSVINWLNDSSSERRYAISLDVDRDNSISPLDVLAVINHINSQAGSTPPTPFVSLNMNDTGASDSLTSSVGVQGKVRESNSKLFVSLDGSSRKEVVGGVAANGQFDLTDAAMAQLFGVSLEGDHLLTISTVGSDGVWRGMDRRFSRTVRSLNAFELKTAVQNGGLFLGWSSAGEGARYRVMREVAGQSAVMVVEGLSDESTRVDLPVGDHKIFVEAYDHVGNVERTPSLLVKIV